MQLDKRIVWALLGIMIVVQLAIPASMIGTNEIVKSEGKRMEFRVAPIDPNDPFRGKFIVLDFEHDVVPNRSHDYWEGGELAYAVLGRDSFGYYLPIKVSKTIPLNQEYLEMRVRYSSDSQVWLDYPFDKFYMEESKAPLAEDLYFEMSRDEAQHVYAVVYVKDGKAVLEDVQINGVSIVELTNVVD